MPDAASRLREEMTGSHPAEVICAGWCDAHEFEVLKTARDVWCGRWRRRGETEWSWTHAALSLESALREVRVRVAWASAHAG